MACLREWVEWVRSLFASPPPLADDDAAPDASSPLLGFTACTPDADAINVAVVGRGYTGKTSLVAALMQYTGDYPRPGFAGASGTPTRHNVLTRAGMPLVLWEFPQPATGPADLPTRGAADPFRGFQGVIVVTNNRWMEFEGNVVAHCRATNMPFVVARTKTDEDVESLEEDQDTPATEAVAYIRQHMLQSIAKLHLPDEHLFLISSRRRQINKFDTPRLRAVLESGALFPKQGAAGTSSGPAQALTT